MNEETDIDQILKDLEAGIKGDTETPAEPTAEAPAEPVEPTEAPAEKTDDVDLKEAAYSVFARMTPEERIEYVKKLGLKVADEKSIEQDKAHVATGTAKLTAQEMLKSLQSQVSPDELPDGYDELDPVDQNLILADLITSKKADKMTQERLQPFEQERQDKELQKAFDVTSQEWAKGHSVPEAAPKIREYIGQFTPDEVALYMRQAENGGGNFVRMVMDDVKNIADQVRQERDANEQKPVPKSEPVGGKEVYTEPALSDTAKAAYARYEKDPDFMDDKEGLKRIKAQLAGIQ